MAGFIGSPRMNFFDTRVRDVADGRLILELPGGEPAELEAETAGVTPGDALRLGVTAHLPEGAFNLVFRAGAGSEGLAARLKRRMIVLGQI